MSNIYKNFRDIYSEILKDNNNAKLLADEQNSTIENTRKKYIASFLINHTFEIYTYNMKSLIPEEFWQRVITDMKVLYKWNFIRQQWEEMQPLFSRDFVEFINENILARILN